MELKLWMFVPAGLCAYCIVASVPFTWANIGLYLVVALPLMALLGLLGSSS